MIPVEFCCIAWQESLLVLAQLAEPDTRDPNPGLIWSDYDLAKHAVSRMTWDGPGTARARHRGHRGGARLHAGRAVVALASDPSVLEKSGRLVDVGALAQEYGSRTPTVPSRRRSAYPRRPRAGRPIRPRPPAGVGPGGWSRSVHATGKVNQSPRGAAFDRGCPRPAHSSEAAGRPAGRRPLRRRHPVPVAPVPRAPVRARWPRASRQRGRLRFPGSAARRRTSRRAQ